MHYLNLKKTNIRHQGPCKNIQLPTNRNKPNKKIKERARGPQENKIKRKQARQLRAEYKNKINKHSKFESSQYTRKEDSNDSRKIQAHQTR